MRDVRKKTWLFGKIKILSEISSFRYQHIRKQQESNWEIKESYAHTANSNCKFANCVAAKIKAGVYLRLEQQYVVAYK